MKKFHIITAILCVISLIILVPGFAAAESVVGSKHDFSTGGTSGFQSDSEEVCVFCHTPHGALYSDTSTENNPIPLWNRDLQRGQSFTMYSSSTFQGTYLPDNKPTGMTLLCLSCHDGVSTINAVLNVPNTGTFNMPEPGNSINDYTYPPWNDPNIGRDLRNDHPVSFQYTPGLVSADQTARGGVLGLNPPGSVTFPGNSTAKLILYNQRMECPTCHDPHDEGSPDKIPFLRMSNAGSAMCTTCHIK